MAHRVLDGKKVWWTMAKLLKENIIFREVKRKFYERVVIPTVVYSSETWSLNARERRKIEEFEKHVYHKGSGQSKKRVNKRERCGS